MHGDSKCLQDLNNVPYSLIKNPIIQEHELFKWQNLISSSLNVNHYYEDVWSNFAPDSDK